MNKSNDPAQELAERILSIANVRIDLLKKGTFDACVAEIRAYGEVKWEEAKKHFEDCANESYILGKSEGFALARELAAKEVESMAIGSWLIGASDAINSSIERYVGKHISRKIRALQMPEETK